MLISTTGASFIEERTLAIPERGPGTFDVTKNASLGRDGNAHGRAKGQVCDDLPPLTELQWNEVARALPNDPNTICTAGNGKR